ncbi:DNA circularization N-terminal domain-containing protein [Bradyrhizobium sp. USDA 4350]
MARDWLKTLWRASYKGTPFFVEHDEEEGGRRIVVHQFPMRDDPYLEDLGEDKRGFVATAYVASDSADTDAGTLVATCAMRGPGVLVLPTHGPILVRCLNFKRARAKDRHGYIGFELEFIREGFSSPLASVAMLANLVFMAADAAALSIATAFVAGIQTTLQPDYVIAAASNGAQDAVSTVEAIRTTQPVDPVVSAAQRTEIQSIFDAAPALVVATDPAVAQTLPARIIASARAVGDATPAPQATAAFEAIVSDPALSDAVAAAASVGTAYPTPHRRAAAMNDAAAKRLLLLAAVIAYAEAATRQTLADRPAAITLRANVAEYFEGVLILIPAGEIDLFHAIAAVRDRVIEYLSRAILDLAPVVTVEANLSMPSLFWAYRLYADPNRSTELAARNLVPHPSFMPTQFEALSK